MEEERPREAQPGSFADPYNRNGDRYDGAVCTPEDDFLRAGNVFGDNRSYPLGDLWQPENRESIESLRELLPFAAMGWAPETISGEGNFCGPRALTRSLENMLDHHYEREYRLPSTFTSSSLVDMLRSRQFRTWRSQQLQKLMQGGSWGDDVEDFAMAPVEEGNNFTDQDINYLLWYINYLGLLPMKFRLGYISQSYEYVNPQRFRITKTNIMAPPVDDNSQHPVAWVMLTAARPSNRKRKPGEKLDSRGHWESIGPEPNWHGIQLFRSWGLYEEAKRVVEAGLFYVTSEGAEEYARDLHRHGDHMVRLQANSFLYKHAARALSIYPAEYTAEKGDDYIIAVHSRSTLHDGYKSNDTINPPQISDLDKEGYVYIGEPGETGGFADWKRYGRGGVLLPVQRIEKYAHTTGGSPGGLRFYAREAVNGVKGTGEFHTPSSQIPSFGGINDHYHPTGQYNGSSSSSLPGSSSAPQHGSTPLTSPPEPIRTTRRAEPPKPAEAPKPAEPRNPHLKSPRKRPPPGGPGSGPERGIPLKKPRNDSNDRHPVLPPANLVGIKPSIRRAYSERPIRMFRAKEDSDVRSTGSMCDELSFKANDILVAIQPIPDKPSYPFLARTQDLREGYVAPGVLVEFTEELYGQRFLPFGLQNEEVLTPVPMRFHTYLLLGERHCSSLRKECGVDMDAQWPNDLIKQILEHRIRRGIPMAFWKILNPAVCASSSIGKHYVRMKNWNSRHFHADTPDGRALVWHEDPRAKHHYLPKCNEVAYAHDKNWGLQLGQKKDADDLNSDDTTLIKESDKVMPSNFYLRPVVHKPLTLLQKAAKKGRNFLFGEPMSGDKTRFSFQTTLDYELYNFRKSNGFDNSDPTPRFVIAVEQQYGRGTPGHGKCLQFGVGDKIFMEAPVGPRPYKGWMGNLEKDGRLVPLSGFVYPYKVRDLKAEEKEAHNSEVETAKDYDDTWLRRAMAEDDAKSARRKAAVYGGILPTAMPTQANGATEETTTETPPESKSDRVQSGQWFGNAPIRPERPTSAEWFGNKSNAKAALDAYVKFEKERLNDTQKRAKTIKDQHSDAEKKASKLINFFEEWSSKHDDLGSDKWAEKTLEAASLCDLLEKAGILPENLRESFQIWENSPDGKKFTLRKPTPPTPSPAPRLPKYVKQLHQGSSIAGKNAKTRDNEKGFKHFRTSRFTGQPKAPPKMGPLGKDKTELSTEEKLKREKEEIEKLKEV